jgi:hypothetical protein
MNMGLSARIKNIEISQKHCEEMLSEKKSSAGDVVITQVKRKIILCNSNPHSHPAIELNFTWMSPIVDGHGTDPLWTVSRKV